ncbi:MAG TPA: Sb-PDE family phosphodiesterase [Flavitalea sp.]|nr:Sb-PDE family phosphodiesterase [Flavitalea sp.]
MKFKIPALCIGLSFCLPVAAQRDSVSLPDIPGFVTLKCDFHLHTAFSDGHVWPTFRVNEAVRDNMDAISLTEHIDYEGAPDEIQRNYNRSYEIALERAKTRGKGLLIIKGAEISPRVPPYHNNAIFLKDIDALPIGYMKSGKKQFVMQDKPTKEQLMAPFLEAQKQGAFVFYNHPGYSWWDKKDTNIFTSFHQELYDKGILRGVEVANSGRYNIIAHRLAMKYNLTMFSNTDEHYDAYARYEKTHRPMTLVFAREKSEKAIREALDTRRTAVYVDDYIIARQPEAEALFKASLSINARYATRNGEKIIVVSIFNRSSVPYRTRFSADHDIEDYPLGELELKPFDTTRLTITAVWNKPDRQKLKAVVSNIAVTPDEPLQIEFLLPVADEISAIDSLKIMRYNAHHANPPKRPDDISLIER